MTMLPVQRGDSLTMSAFALYPMDSQPGKSWALAAFVSSLFHSSSPPPGTEGYRNGRYTPYIGLALGASITALQPDPGVPNAYLKYIVLDQDSNYVYSEVQVISSAAGQNWQELKLHYKVEQDGFVQVFVYNESGQEVFFDDITIRKDLALIVQENHYDPWGLNLVGIEMQGTPDHKFQYNDKEKQEELGLQWNDFDARHQDPQLGRFLNVDPHSENYFENSPYGFVLNNPLRYSDPTGMDTVNANTNQHVDKNDVIQLDDGSFVTANAGQTFIAGTANAAAREVLENNFFVRFMAGRDVVNQAIALDTRDKEGPLAYRYVQINNAHREIGLEFSLGGYLNPFYRASIAGKPITRLNPYELEITHGITKSKSGFARLKADIVVNGVKEPIKFVEHNGKRYVVDGHHRLRAAKELGVQSVPVQQVQLPYAGYKTTADLIYSRE